MTLNLDKQNSYRERYAHRRPQWRPGTEVYEQVIRDYLKPEMRVLDAGCGRGGVLEQLGIAVTYPYGIDPDFESIRTHRLPNLPRVCASIGSLPFADGYFDMLINSWVLEHLAEPETIFYEIQRVLKPGGYFIFITPGKYSLVAWLNRVLKPLQNTLVPLLYGREEADAFPVVYRANTGQKLLTITQQTGLELMALHRIKDPSYLAFHPVLFEINVLLSRLSPPSMAEHLIGICRKSG